MPLPSKKLRPDSQKALVEYMENCYKRLNLNSIRKRYEEIDLAMQLESREAKEQTKERADYTQLTELGVIQPFVSTVKGFLVDLFLQNQPVFKPISADPNLTGAVKQMEALITEHAEQYKWARHLALVFNDLPKYNFGVIDVQWKQEEITVPSTDRATREDGKAVLKTIERVGNTFTRWDPYNTFYDDTVPIAELHERGEFLGHIENISMIEVVKRFNELTMNGGKIMNADEVFKTSVNPNRYFTPAILDGANVAPKGYQQHFTPATAATKISRRPYSLGNLTNVYEWVTLYTRIIPSMWGIVVGKANSVQVWKLQYCNNMLVSAQPLDEVHGYFSAVAVQITEEGLNEQTKTLAELTIPVQNLQNRMHHNRLSALARNIGGRYAYVEGAVSRSDITNPDPRTPIAVRPNSWSKNIKDLLTEIPFTDTSGASFINEMEYLNTRGERLMRLNRAQQGQFQKGNKTLGEFKEIMGNANADLRVMALLVEISLMAVLKSIVRNNIFQYQPPVDVVGSDGVRQTVNPAELRDASLKFKMADGLIVKEDLVDIQVLREFMQFAATDQTMQQTYDVPGILAFIYTSQGNVDLSSFKRPQPAAAPAQAPAATPPAGGQA